MHSVCPTSLSCLLLCKSLACVCTAAPSFIPPFYGYLETNYVNVSQAWSSANITWQGHSCHSCCNPICAILTVSIQMFTEFQPLHHGLLGSSHWNVAKICMTDRLPGTGQPGNPCTLLRQVVVTEYRDTSNNGNAWILISHKAAAGEITHKSMT